MSQPCVLSQVPLQQEAYDILAANATVVTSTSGTSDAWFAEAASSDALLISGLLYMTGPVMDRIGPRLRVIARPGIGVDRIDLDAATERGIMVLNTPDGPTESTAEHAVALMMGLAKIVAISDRALRAGVGFPVYGTLPLGLELRDAVLGLVGLGRIGGRVAEIARVLGMRVIAFDPFVSPQRVAELGVETVASLEELLPIAQVVSIHCPSIPATRHLINAETLALMQPGSYLVNVSRGPIIDESALLEALRSGHLAGAGLDVFDPEPPDPNNPLFSLPNTICTAHVGSYTSASVLRMQVMAAEQIVYGLRGERPPELVNRDVWGRQRR